MDDLRDQVRRRLQSHPRRERGYVGGSVRLGGRRRMRVTCRPADPWPVSGPNRAGVAWSHSEDDGLAWPLPSGCEFAVLLTGKAQAMTYVGGAALS